MSIRDEARAQALVEYAHGKVRDRYDADLMMAGFEDGAAWQAKREPAKPIEVNDAMTAVPEAAMPAIRKTSRPDTGLVNFHALLTQLRVQNTKAMHLIEDQALVIEAALKEIDQ